MKYCQASGAKPARCSAAADPSELARYGRGLRVRVALREFVQRADVVEVVVRRDRGERLVEEIGRGFGQAHDAEPAVDEHRTVATAHEPHVAAQERVHVLFPEVPRAVVELAAREPRCGRGLHGAACYETCQLRQPSVSAAIRCAIVSAARCPSAKYWRMRRAPQ